MMETALSCLAPVGGCAARAVHGSAVPAGSEAAIAAFERALSSARVDAGSGMGLAPLLEPFSRINAESARLSSQVAAVVDSGRDLTPGEVALLSVRCHAYMVQCQFTASVAHRAADGVQQLLRQPS